VAILQQSADAICESVRRYWLPKDGVASNEKRSFQMTGGGCSADSDDGNLARRREAFQDPHELPAVTVR
jgi:hypothetical protein